MSAQKNETNQEAKENRYEDAPVVRLSADDSTAVVNMIKWPAPANDFLKEALKKQRGNL